ncbi:hypothetical protein BD410DRAFT_790136 [Rickenella mellea]|uniref:Uncharacterized protein n=1 Tax=Rickenella mellea TaxID=50990 RepID=A0A4Y7Q199_9AGAM|nr:hypothetical protein BD410DRAFT_790136 [Rickenella mellea]
MGIKDLSFELRCPSSPSHPTFVHHQVAQPNESTLQSSVSTSPVIPSLHHHHHEKDVHSRAPLHLLRTRKKRRWMRTDRGTRFIPIAVFVGGLAESPWASVNSEKEKAVRVGSRDSCGASRNAPPFFDLVLADGREMRLLDDERSTSWRATSAWVCCYPPCPRQPLRLEFHVGLGRSIRGLDEIDQQTRPPLHRRTELGKSFSGKVARLNIFVPDTFGVALCCARSSPSSSVPSLSRRTLRTPDSHTDPPNDGS